MLPVPGALMRLKMGSWWATRLRSRWRFAARRWTCSCVGRRGRPVCVVVPVENANRSVGRPEVGLVVDRTSVRGSAAFGKKRDPCAAHQIGDDLGGTDGSLRDLLWCSCTTVVSVSAVWSSSTSRPLAHQSGSVEVCGWLVMDGVAKSDLGPGINGSHAAESSTFQRYRAHAAAPSELAVVCQPGGRDGVLDAVAQFYASR